MFFARVITFYEELFDEGGSLEGDFCPLTRALLHFMKSCLTRVDHLKAVSLVFFGRIITFYEKLCVEDGSLEAVSVVFARA